VPPAGDGDPVPIRRTSRQLPAARTRFLVVLVLIAVVAVVALVARQNVHTFAVLSGSMESTIATGTRVTFEMSQTVPLRVGEVVVFHPPMGASSTQQSPACGPVAHVVIFDSAACAEPVPQPERATFVKRIVAGPGDTISIVEGHVIRDGKREQDPYVRPCSASAVAVCNFPTPITIPAGHYFLLGDNRGVSDDSRFWGPVPRGWIIGKAVRCSFFDFFCTDAYRQ
jgi:signal peptidase I